MTLAKTSDGTQHPPLVRPLWTVTRKLRDYLARVGDMWILRPSSEAIDSRALLILALVNQGAASPRALRSVSSLASARCGPVLAQTMDHAVVGPLGR